MLHPPPKASPAQWGGSTLSNNHWGKHSLRWRGLACGKSRLTQTRKTNTGAKAVLGGKHRRVYLNCKSALYVYWAAVIFLSVDVQIWIPGISDLIWRRFFHKSGFHVIIKILSKATDKLGLNWVLSLLQCVLYSFESRRFLDVAKCRNEQF